MGKSRSNIRTISDNERSNESNEYEEFTTENGKHTINVREVTNER